MLDAVTAEPDVPDVPEVPDEPGPGAVPDPASGPAPAGRGEEGVPPRLLVTADLALIAGTVAAALIGQGFRVQVEAWPAGPDTAWSAPATADLCLALCDLDSSSSLATTLALVGPPGPPWIVLTDTAPGPLWGAALEAGAARVLSSSTSVAGTSAAIHGVLSGAAQPDQQDSYVQAWQQLRRTGEDQVMALEALSPTERDVLAALYAGHSVRRIARSRGVAESTVRYQVAAVRRKLGVDSQLAAVAVYARATAAHPVR